MDHFRLDHSITPHGSRRCKCGSLVKPHTRRNEGRCQLYRCREVGRGSAERDGVTARPGILWLEHHGRQLDECPESIQRSPDILPIGANCVDVPENENVLWKKTESADQHDFETRSYPGHLFRQYLKNNHKDKERVPHFRQNAQQHDVNNKQPSVTSRHSRRRTLTALEARIFFSDDR